MIGNDADTDIAGARQAGMDSFYIHSAISPGNQAGMAAETLRADYVMKKMNLRALKDRLLATEL